MKKLVAAIEEHVAFYGPHGNRSLPFHLHSLIQ